MKKILIAIAFVVSGYYAVSQNLDIPAFGEDSTFEMMTWNIEWFPKNGQTTVDYVSEIIQDLEVDVIAMQELDDTVVFNQMMSNLQDYKGYYESSYFAGLAYIYNSKVIEVDSIYEILTSQPYWRPFPRSPMVMELHFKGEKIIVINNHFKCCGDGILDTSDDYDEEKRRLDASVLLKEYIDEFFENEKVILTGDLNDILTDAPQNNVFNSYIEDSENYRFVDMDIAEGNSNNWSYPSWPSHLDHVLITNELFEDFSNPGSTIESLRIDDYFSSWSQYDSKVSDHRPVAIKINSDSFLGQEEFIPTNEKLVSYPNPASSHIIVETHSIEPIKFEIISLPGIIVLDGTISSTDNKIDVSDLRPSIYILKVGDHVLKVRKSK